jgi:hypothetical protein
MTMKKRAGLVNTQLNPRISVSLLPPLNSREHFIDNLIIPLYNSAH